MDRNGNGTIDPDEQQGPAQFLIQRLQSADSSIKPGQPISIKRVTEAFQKMREGGDRGSSRGGSRSNGDEGLTPELLVPGFGNGLAEGETAPSLLGFGPAAEMMSVTVTEEDREEARNNIRRYDRNRNGVLDKNEISSRFSGNPLDFDRNKDGRLTEGELAVRYARRRETAEDSRNDDRNRRDRDRGGDVEMVDVYGGRKSYRVLTADDLPKDLPGFFAEKDTNRDGQIEMSEFAETWDDETVEEFFKSDLNRDGHITIAEAYQAVEELAATRASGAMASVGSSDRGGSDTGSSASAAPAAGPVGEVDDKMIAYAERIIGRYDSNNDKQLVKSEYEKMLMSPVAADANRDGIITVKEYALWMQSRRR
ncbi:hypothetical protein C2E31_08690 [Rhodopirellula baltica]|nr:hypothetical protein C2E31_08690 [Rhodopirellula baltica]